MYNEKQFKNCVFNPMTAGRMLETYLKLNEIIDPEWPEDPELDKLIRYTIFVYDPGSFLAQNEKDLNYRKGTAVELAGFDAMLDDQEYITSIYSCTHPFISDLIARYLIRFAKSKEWSSVVVVEHCYWEAVSHLMKPITGDNSKAILDAVQKKSALKDELDKDIARLEKYQKAFFGGDEIMESAFKRKSYASPERLLKTT